ncbi:MAG: imelysin family protein [Rhizobium sp.]
MRIALSLIASLCLAFPAVAQDRSAEIIPMVMEKAVDDFIRPGYRHFRQTADDLQTSMRALCAEPSAGNLKSARTAFGQTVSAWSRIEIVRVGPVIEDNRFERILFYPDRKGTGLKQVQAILATPDESAAAVETLMDKSVAMQGLGALEFVLFGTGSDILANERSGFRCRYGAAIAGNLLRLGGELAAEWDKPGGIQAAWKQPGPDNPVFRDGREAITALLGILVHGAEAIRDHRIETFYKGKDSKAFPRQAIYWRSGNTWNSIHGNLEGLRSLLDRSDMVALLDGNSRSVIASIDFVTRSLIRMTEDMNPDIEAAVADEAERARLDFLLLNSKDLIMRLSDEFGGAIGLGAGFSFSDGD